MPKVSVIIPVYNAEKTLEYCLNSIIEQSFKDIEIICINDGSQDNSLEILKQYSHFDKRIIIVDQSNSGVSAARNRGLDVASGDYIMFCDSDDKFEYTACEKIVQKFDQTDADVVGFAHYNQKNGKIYDSNIKVLEDLNNRNCKNKQTKEINFQIYIWNKAYKRAFLNRNNILFNNDLKNAEDMLFCFSIYLKGANYAYIPEALYVYNIDGNGDTVWDNQKGVLNDYKSYKYLTSSENFKLQPECIKMHITQIYLQGSNHYYHNFADTEDRIKIINDIKDFLSYTQEVLPIAKLNKIKSYKKLKKILWKNEKHWYFKLFNIQTFKNKKIITILAKDIVLRRESNKKLPFLKKIFSLRNSKDDYYKILTILNFNIFIKKDSFDKLYKQKIKELKNKKNIRVCFLVNEISKWKTQSLYDLFKSSKNFEPFVVVTIADRQWNLNKNERLKIIENTYKYFEERKICCEIGYDTVKDRAMSLKKFKPDIVFYQQPWQISKVQQPKKVAKYALTCYVPYFVPNYGILQMDCQNFHKNLFRYYVLNDDWKNIYFDYMGDYGKNLVAVGHTMLDYFYLKSNFKQDKNYVIYAPHWTIPHEKNINDQNYSTFLENGAEILEYAKQHPEINWAFKPHPTLKIALKNVGWNASEIDNYYKEWESFAKCCYDSDYMELFMQSKALITDCGSFLIEYFCTGKPILHLISKFSKACIPEPTKKILNTFYKIKNNSDLYKYFNDIIINNNDYKKEQRELELKNSKLLNNYAAQNIVDDINEIIGKK